MKQKNRLKSWLIKALRNWLAKLEPYHNVVKVEHTYVPLATVNASFTWPKGKQISEDHINEILARKLSEEVIKYADIECCKKINMSAFEEYMVFRATVRVAEGKRG